MKGRLEAGPSAFRTGKFRKIILSWAQELSMADAINSSVIDSQTSVPSTVAVVVSHLIHCGKRAARIQLPVSLWVWGEST